jgi:hypothetical protein
MALLRFLKLPEHQQYDYKPRFWDPQKEELEERLKRIDEIQDGGTAGARARISGGFRRGYNMDSKVRSRQVMRSNLMLIGVVVALVVLSYLMISVYLPQIVEMLNTPAALE